MEIYYEAAVIYLSNCLPGVRSTCKILSVKKNLEENLIIKNVISLPCGTGPMHAVVVVWEISPWYNVINVSRSTGRGGSGRNCWPMICSKYLITVRHKTLAAIRAAKTDVRHQQIKLTWTGGLNNSKLDWMAAKKNLAYLPGTAEDLYEEYADPSDSIKRRKSKKHNYKSEWNDRGGGITMKTLALK